MPGGNKNPYGCEGVPIIIFILIIAGFTIWLALKT